VFGRQTFTRTKDPTMTDEMMRFRTLLEKSSDADLLREMVGFAAQRLMELEVESLTGATHGERSPERINHRNGFASGFGRPAPGPSSCASPSCARAVISRPFWSRAAWRRRALAAAIQGSLRTRSIDTLGR
jgi:hypothetical protein